MTSFWNDHVDRALLKFAFEPVYFSRASNKGRLRWGRTLRRRRLRNCSSLFNLVELNQLCYRGGSPRRPTLLLVWTQIGEGFLIDARDDVHQRIDDLRNVVLNGRAQHKGDFI